MNKTFTRSLAAMLFAAAAPACAQSWYAGLAAGSTKGDVDTGRINGDLANLGFFSASTSSDDSAASWRVFAGLRLLPWLDIEAHYADLGKTRFDSTVTPAGTLAASIRAKAFGVGALAGFVPIDRLRLFAKGGIARTETKAHFSSTGFVELDSSSVTKRRTAAFYGVGAQYDFSPTLAARVEYDVHTKLGSDAMGGEFDASTASIGLLLRF